MQIKNHMIYSLAMMSVELPYDERRALASLGDLDGHASIGAVMRWCRCSDEEARAFLRSLYLKGYLVERADGLLYQPQIRCAMANRIVSPAPRKYRPRAGNISSLRRAAILLRDGHCCVYCGSSGNDRSLTIDHVVAKSKGGLSTDDNLVAACAPCNQVKADRDLDSFLEVA